MCQESFSRLWDGFESDKAALKARNKRAKELRAKGDKAICWTLPNQEKKYDGLGQYNGSVCNVYMINVERSKK